MSQNNNASSQATAMLRMRLKEISDPANPLLKSMWPVFERLIARESEMAPVWDELSERRVTGIPLWILTEQCMLAAVEGESGEHETLRAEYRELQTLNEDITVMSIRLAQLLESRDTLLNKSGHFHVERMLRLTDIMNAAGRENYLYQTWVRPELEKLGQFDLKYWPDMPALLHAVGEESQEITFRYDASEAIALARPSLRTDFLRNVFDRIREISDGSAHGLRPDFRLSDASLATLCNVLCDLPPDEIADAAYVKGARQRLRKQGFSAAW